MSIEYCTEGGNLTAPKLDYSAPFFTNPEAIQKNLTGFVLQLAGGCSFTKFQVLESKDGTSAGIRLEIVKRNSDGGDAQQQQTKGHAELHYDHESKLWKGSGQFGDVLYIVEASFPYADGTGVMTWQVGSDKQEAAVVKV